MRNKKYLKIFLALFIGVTLAYVFSGIRTKSKPDYNIPRAEGEKMSFTFYDLDRKSLEVKCLESRKGEKDRIYMKQIEVLIYKKGRMKKNIRAMGANGFIENNDHNFFLEKNARIVSEDFTVTSDHFNLKDRADLTSAPKVKYRAKALNGKANGGMMFHLNVNTLKFFNTLGTYKKDEKTFEYGADTLWVIDKDKVMVMEKNSFIRDTKSILRSGWITIKFDKDFKEIMETSSQQGSYLYVEDTEKNEIKEIKSENLRSIYNEEGQLTEMSVMNNAHILLKGTDNQTNIISNVVNMYFDGPTGMSKRAEIPQRGVVQNSGKRRFRVASDRIDVFYNKKGEIKECKGVGNSRFNIRKYKGTTHEVAYNIESQIIKLEGENSKLLSEGNTFYSEKFKVDVENNILTSRAGVKSVVKMQKDSVLFSKDSIFINAVQFEIDEKKNRFTYRNAVTLTQGDILLSGKSLEITEDNQIRVEGRASLTFKSNEKEMAIKGEKLYFNPKKKTITILNRAVIKNDENILKADDFLIRFNDTNEVEQIIGRDNVKFQKELISGSSDRVEWRFKEDVMVLKGKPVVRNKDGGRTSGRELKIDLKTGTISIISSGSRRTETIIR